jgi:hypothetical protein
MRVADRPGIELPLAPTEQDIVPCLIDYINTKEIGDTDVPTGWPDKIWVLEYKVPGRTGVHGIIPWGDVHGLGAFRKKADCLAFAKVVRNPPSKTFEATQVSFEEAVKIVYGKRDRITAIILIDKLPCAHPLVHFVR